MSTKTTTRYRVSVLNVNTNYRRTIMIDLTKVEFDIPAHKEVYPDKIRKLSKRRRKPCSKNLGVLEYGNSAIVITLAYNVTLSDKLTEWWEICYQVHNLNWNVELFIEPAKGYIEVVIFEDTCFYRADDFHLKSVQDEPETYYQKGIQLLPECFHDYVVGLRLEDWDYSVNPDRVTG